MQGKATFRKSDGKFLEFQSGEPQNSAMINNAKAQGIEEIDIEVRELSDAETSTLMEKIKLENEKTAKKSRDFGAEIDEIKKKLGMI